eukprot:g1446.t1
MLAPASRSDFRGGPRLRARQLLRAAPAALLFHALQPTSARTPSTGKAKAVTVESPRSSTTYADEPSNLPLQTPRERYLGRKLTYVGPGLRGWNKNQLMPSAEDVKDIHFLPFETEHDHATTSWLQTTDTMHLEREHEYLHDVKHWDKLSAHHDNLLEHGPPAHESARLVPFSHEGGEGRPITSATAAAKPASSSTSFLELENAAPLDAEQAAADAALSEVRSTFSDLNAQSAKLQVPEMSPEKFLNDDEFDIYPDTIAASTLVGLSDGSPTSQEAHVGPEAQTFIETAPIVVPAKIAQSRKAKAEASASTAGAGAVEKAGGSAAVEKTTQAATSPTADSAAESSKDSSPTMTSDDNASAPPASTAIELSSTVTYGKAATSLIEEPPVLPVAIEAEKRAFRGTQKRASQVPEGSLTGEPPGEKNTHDHAAAIFEEHYAYPSAALERRSGNLRASNAKLTPGDRRSSVLQENKKKEGRVSEGVSLGNLPALLGAAVKGMPNLVSGIINPTISSGPQLIGSKDGNQAADQLLPNQLGSLVTSPFHQLFGDKVEESGGGVRKPSTDSEPGEKISDAEMKRLNRIHVPENEKVVPLSDLRDHTSQHLGTIYFGENKQPASVIFDTGSTNLWVLSDLCKSETCLTSDEPAYGIEKSGANAHYFADQSRLEITFGSGTLAGPQAVDSITVARHFIKTQPFAMIEEERGSVFKTLRYGGIMGLAFESMAAHGMVGVMTQAMRENVFSGHNQMSFYFTRNPKIRSGAYFGGANPSLYHGTPQCLDVVHEHYWQTGVHRMGIMWGKDAEPEWIDNEAMGVWNDESVGKPLSAIWDTGTTWNAVPTYLNNYILQKLREKGFAEVACSKVRKHFVGSNPDG